MIIDVVSIWMKDFFGLIKSTFIEKDMSLSIEIKHPSFGLETFCLFRFYTILVIKNIIIFIDIYLLRNKTFIKNII